MYRPSAVAFARVLIDLPLIAFQHIIFIISFYFLVRLQVDAAKFFFFYLTLFLSTVNFSNLLRMFAYFVPSLDDCEYFTMSSRIDFGADTSKVFDMAVLRALYAFSLRDS
jgi:hypothetical protein